MCNQMHKHDSKKEANRCDELTLLEKAGEIRDLREQVRITLAEKFVFQGKTIRSIVYIADFTYFDKGKFIIEDTKGYRTEVYKIKRKLLLSIMALKDRDDFQFLET